MPKNSELAISEGADPDTARLQKMCMAADNGHTIGALMRNNIETGTTVLALEVKRCAITYCGAPNTDTVTIAESVRFVHTQYSHLTLNEISEAFRLAAAQKIDADLSAFHGLFSVRILGQVLSAYDTMRGQVAREVRARLRKLEDEQENQIRSERMLQMHGTISDQFAALVENNEKYARWQDMPEWFCERVVRDDVAGFSLDEKGKAWIIARQWSANQLANWIVDPQTTKADRSRYIEVEQAYKENPDVFPEGLKKEAQSAYCKMLVFDRIAKYTNP